MNLKTSATSLQSLTANAAGYSTVTMKESARSQRRYVAPELAISYSSATGLTSPPERESDWWSVGMLVGEMIGGLVTEMDNVTTNNGLSNKIGSGSFDSLVGADTDWWVPIRSRLERFGSSEAARMFVKKALTNDPKERLGHLEDAAEVKSHPFFEGIDWNKVLNREYEPLFRPDVLQAAGHVESSPLI
ncbi:hypothetical protein HDU76_000124 [Blyttiomyces sp. JEL0837]|nr:hypothetical protein HDU76_000124 [Blyttiomyces sp. JEL0837]